jgi:hypothetical protein
LNLRHLYGSHSDENVVKIIMNVIDKYKIAENIKYIMLDNISSNDTCVKEILRKFNINDIKK